MEDGRAESDARALAARVEALLGDLAATGDRASALGEDLVRALAGFYGAGLEHLVARLDEPTRIVAAEDPLVGALFALHGLHPVPVEARVAQALDRVRPALGAHSGGVEVLGFDDAGVLHLRLEGSCHGCPSSLVTVRSAIEGAVLDAAPELAGVEVEGVVDPAAPTPVLLQIEPAPSAPVHAADGSDCPAVVGATP